MNANDQSQYQFIGNVAYNSAATINALPNGAIAVIDADNNVQTGAMTSTAYYRIAQRKADGGLLVSPQFLAGDLFAKSQTAYTPSKNQVTYLGTNSSDVVTGLGTITAGDTYSIGIGIKGHGGNQVAEHYHHIVFGAATGDTNASAAKGLFESAQRGIKRNTPFQYLSVERIAAVTSVAAFTGDSTIYKLTKNSKIVTTYVKDADATTGLTASTASVAASTATTAIAIASTNGRTFTFSADAAGTGAGRHIIYIGETTYNVADGGTDAQNATAIAAAINAGTQAIASAAAAVVTVTYRNEIYLTPPMVVQTDDDSTYTNIAVTTTVGESKPVAYRVETATTTAATFILDAPWQGETCYLYEGTGATTTASIGVSTITSDVWGLKISALPKPNFDFINDNTLPITFRVNPMYGSDAFATTVLATDKQGASVGSGSYKQVADREHLDQFQNKFYNVQVRPRTVYKTEANANNVYTLLEFRVPKELNSNMPGANVKTFISIELAVSSVLADNTTLATVFGL